MQILRTGLIAMGLIGFAACGGSDKGGDTVPTQDEMNETVDGAQQDATDAADEMKEAAPDAPADGDW